MSGRIRRALSIERDEGVAVAWAAIYFFFLLLAYFLIRPVREAMGVQRSFYDLYPLFIGTMVTTFVGNALYGRVVARIPRRWIVALVHRFFMVNLVGFALVLLIWPDLSLRIDAARVGWLGADTDVVLHTGHVFFVWLSVFNIFIVAVFRSLMADGFTLEQGKRLFGLIGIGGTLGALVGSSTAWQLVEWAEARLARLGEESAIVASLNHETTVAAGLMLCSVVMLEVATWCSRGFDRSAVISGDSLGSRLGGRSLAGFGEVVRSPYLLGICAYILLFAVASTLIYFTQVRLVTEQADDLVTRIKLFSHIESLTQVLTLVLQAFLTSRLLRRIGIGPTLLILPALTVTGFLALYFVPEASTYATLVIFQALFRATQHAIQRPARETLFTVVSRSEKYKAKAVLDTFVYRGGDVIGMVSERVLVGWFGVALAGVAFGAMPVGVLWGMIGLWLGVTQRSLSKRAERADA